jgi:hypothetical protein
MRTSRKTLKLISLIVITFFIGSICSLGCFFYVCIKYYQFPTPRFLEPQIIGNYFRYGYGKVIWNGYLLFHPDMRSDKIIYFMGADDNIYLVLSIVAKTLPPLPVPIDGLSLEECKIDDLQSLKDKKLKYISITESTVGDIPLFSHKTIRAIFLQNSNISTLESFSNQPLRLVTIVNLGELSSLSGLSPSIRHLFVRNCKRINSVEGLASLSVIRWLILEGTSVRNISSLSKAENLITLNLNNTLVDDLTPLEKLKNLQTLEIIGTPASKKPLPDWLNKTILRD